MKKDIHPSYQEVLFVDTSTGYRFVCGTALKPTQTETFEGKEYPVVHVSISSASHPFFTGAKQFVDTEGRVDKFMKRYAKVKKVEAKDEEKEESAAPAPKKKEEKKGKKKK